MNYTTKVFLLAFICGFLFTTKICAQNDTAALAPIKPLFKKDTTSFKLRHKPPPFSNVNNINTDTANTLKSQWGNRYSYTILDSSKDRGHARFFFNIMPLTFYADFGNGENTGLYASVQLIYTPKTKTFGIEASSTISLVNGDMFYTRHLFNLGGYLKLKTTWKTTNQMVAVDEKIGTPYYDGKGMVTPKSYDYIKIPINISVNHGVRAGITSETNLIYGYFTPFSMRGIYIGYNRHKNTNIYLQTRRADNGYTRTFDYSKWILINYDILYYPIIESNERPSLKNSFPLGFRVSRQKLFPVSRKSQPEKVHGIFTRLEAGYKPIQGVFVNLSIGWQAIRY